MSDYGFTTATVDLQPREANVDLTLGIGNDNGLVDAHLLPPGVIHAFLVYLGRETYSEWSIVRMRPDRKARAIEFTLSKVAHQIRLDPGDLTAQMLGYALDEIRYDVDSFIEMLREALP